jgi:futalosine hydrolase
MIALLCSVQAEAERILAAMTVMRSTTLGSKLLIEGKLNDRRILLCIGGMGKINAAHAATLMLTQFKPSAIVVFGIGGAYPSSGARVGDIAIANEEIAGDEGVLTQEGFKDAEYIGIPLLKTSTSVIYSTYAAPEHLVKESLRSLSERQDAVPGKVHVGTFITLSACTGTAERARELEERHHGLCENMEGAAVAQIAVLHGIPWLEVRGISNIVEDRNVKTWDIPKAAQSVQQAIIRIVAGWEP